MTNDKNKIREKCENEYSLGKKYKDISIKFNIPINTLKSWKKRYNWTRNLIQKKEGVAQKGARVGNSKEYDKVYKSLLKQLEENETNEDRYIDLINDYMKMWNIKNELIQDIEYRGSVIFWSNGKQQGEKSNDSVKLLLNVNNQMLKILSELNLKPVTTGDGDDDI